MIDKFAKEIGSEFSFENDRLGDFDQEYAKPEFLDLDYTEIFKGGSDFRLLFSGRTAIDYVLLDYFYGKDASDKEFSKDSVGQNLIGAGKTVYLPSYSCYSMLQAFIDRGFKLEFFDVEFKPGGGLDYHIDTDFPAHVFLAMPYFGFKAGSMDPHIEAFKEKNVLVIEDITHRFLSGMNHCPSSDYLIVSLRKWLPLLSGGVAVKMEGSFADFPLSSPSENIIRKRFEAMKLKGRYLSGLQDGPEADSTDGLKMKEEFLALYHESNTAWTGDYSLVEMDSLSVRFLAEADLPAIAEARRRNAGYLARNLIEIPGHLQAIFPEFDSENDAPLFYPLMVTPKLREGLRKHLIDKKIYCPVHWPLSKEHRIKKENKKLYDSELSLICDQRYGPREMARIVLYLKEYLESVL